MEGQHLRLTEKDWVASSSCPGTRRQIFQWTRPRRHCRAFSRRSGRGWRSCRRWASPWQLISVHKQKSMEPRADHWKDGSPIVKQGHLSILLLHHLAKQKPNASQVERQPLRSRATEQIWAPDWENLKKRKRFRMLTNSRKRLLSSQRGEEMTFQPPRLIKSQGIDLPRGQKLLHLHLLWKKT